MSKDSTKEYIEELKKMVEIRQGKPFELWLLPTVRATAMNMVFIDKLQEELMKAELTTSMTGSMGQQKIEVNPLIDKYNNQINTLIRQFKSLGLSFDTAKGKMGGTADEDADDDPVLAALRKR